ncbi:hypothetical protein F442_13166 [Phytophthora nicotianae P10297]|uniref:Uncharacterized protein n=1 Tax=Phytophthora nicotianae P10297 TaxID=1317064 RepID=W2YZJ0_PHYNI|nr:hypothetical protein F442_13166 [Phytophthora nicotianae P10297]
MTSAHANGIAVPRPMSPSSADQRVLASFLLEMNVSDFAPDAQNREKRASTKRKAETLAHPCTKKAKWPWECRNEQLQSLRSEVKALNAHITHLELHRVNGGLERVGDGEMRQPSRNSVLQDLKIECRHIDAAGPTMFNLLENRLNKRIQDIRDVYMVSRASEVRTDFDQIQVHRGGEVPGATALELKRIHLLPFTTNVASKSVWDVMKLGVISSERCARVSIRSEDLLTSQGCFTHELDDVGRVDVRICCLMKRIEGPEGCTVLIESITEWVARLSNLREWKHMTRDSGWVAVRPVASTAQLCQLKLEMRLQTNESVKVSTTQSKRDSLLLARGVSDVMVASVRNVLNSRHQLIDNALLDTRTTQHVAG